MIEKRIAYPVRELHAGTCRIVDAKGEWLSSKQVADALNAALEDAERLDFLETKIRDDRCDIHRNGVGAVAICKRASDTPDIADYGTLRAAIDAARAAQITPDEEAEVRSRIEARTNAKEKA